MPRTSLTLGLALAAPLCVFLALAVGSVDLSWPELWQTLGGNGTELARTLVFELRLPRALSAFAVGGLLALAGVLLQVLLRNPLADPYILGVSGGAAVGALSSLFLGAAGVWVTGGAFAGSLLAMLLVFGLAGARGHWNPARLLLTGVVIAAGWGAVISFLLALAPGSTVQGMLFWLMGDLSRSGAVAPPLFTLAAGVLLALPLARALNLLGRGELAAAALGEDPARLKIMIYFLASLLTAMAVTVAGTVGFVGLVIPHLARLLGGSDHRWLVPNAVLLGGGFLVLADTLARWMLAPSQLPVGVVTALLGVPTFLYLLTRSQRP